LYEFAGWNGLFYINFPEKF